MKKFIFIVIAIVVASVSANAQEWSVNEHEGDELKGTSSYTSYLFEDATGNYFVCWSNSDNVKVCAGSGIFDYKDQTVMGLVGFYKDGSLVEKSKVSFFVPRGKSDVAIPLRDDVNRKIKTYLKSSGDVRIIIPRYGKSDFDITVTMFTDIN